MIWQKALRINLKAIVLRLTEVTANAEDKTPRFYDYAIKRKRQQFAPRSSCMIVSQYGSQQVIQLCDT